MTRPLTPYQRKKFANAWASQVHNNRHLETEVEQADAHQLTTMLFGGILNHLKDALSAATRQDVASKNQRLDKALTCVNQLRLTLRHDLNPELTSNLRRLYDYCGQLLSQAKAKVELTQPIVDVIELISPLKEAWEQITPEVRQFREEIATSEEALEEVQRTVAANHAAAMNPQAATQQLAAENQPQQAATPQGINRASRQAENQPAPAQQAASKPARPLASAMSRATAALNRARPAAQPKAAAPQASKQAEKQPAATSPKVAQPKQPIAQQPPVKKLTPEQEAAQQQAAYQQIAAAAKQPGVMSQQLAANRVANRAAVQRATAAAQAAVAAKAAASQAAESISPSVNPAAKPIALNTAVISPSMDLDAMNEQKKRQAATDPLAVAMSRATAAINRNSRQAATESKPHQD